METVDIVIVGAGVIGLAIAERLSRSKTQIVVVERNDSFGRETSSRNSEVIHCGMYYDEHLLKTSLYVRGNPILYELCTGQGIPQRKTGKIVVTTDRAEEAKLEQLLEQGRENGVVGLQLLTGSEVAEREAQVKASMGLFSPETGIVDTHQLMQYLERSAISRGVTLAYSCEAISMKRDVSAYLTEMRQADGEIVALRSAVVINAAGLAADKVAAMIGIDIDRAGYRIRPCKGEYFGISRRHRGRIRHLIYPAPSSVDIGAHIVLALDNSLKMGPNAFYVTDTDYAVNPDHKREFLEDAIRFLPFLTFEDLSPDMSGIRPKLYGLGEPFRDFVICDEKDKGFPGLINLVGMESPGLTSCLAVAEKVESLL